MLGNTVTGVAGSDTTGGLTPVPRSASSQPMPSNQNGAPSDDANAVATHPNKTNANAASNAPVPPRTATSSVR